ncbi:alpha/beta hydrolase [Winogradskyella flava]|uniref:Alpha/beta hydrolase n=1 Tax=Winogradskyella flava TaxID=1884876 RepID=A0A842IR09_9FLAO|nr:alpha/beta hydrolase-fold protein [Winogradskyella flava]MBC2845642.1 alpha/beta hydrolase [Winogradskyella flava]
MRLRYIYVLLLVVFFNKSYPQSTASEQVTTFTIAAPQLDAIKTIWVYLPKNYKNSKKPYPVIYMHDAQNLFDVKTSYVGEWSIDEYMDALTDNESIIVGIEHGEEKRIAELTPYKHETYGGGQGNAYLTFIKNTLKPHIDVAYKTKSDALNTTIFGSSLGGLISFYAAIKYPETFGKAGIFSPAFWINPELFDLIGNITIPETSKFFFLVGEKEGKTMVPDQERMVAILKSKGVKENQIRNRIIEDGEHNEKFWSTYFGEAYQWLTSKG